MPRRQFPGASGHGASIARMKRGSRRYFLRQAGLTTAGALLARPGATAGDDPIRTVTLVRDPGDHVASSRPAVWAAGELQRALVERGIRWRSVGRLGDAPAGDLCVVAVGKAAPIGLHTKLSDGAEAF